MKKELLIGLVCGGILALISQSSLAGEIEKRKAEPSKIMKPAVVITNAPVSNARLAKKVERKERKERLKRPDLRKEEFLKKYDNDGDGQLSAEERDALRKKMQERRRKIDKNGDGKISKEERQAMIEDMRQRFQAKRPKQN